MNDILSDLFRLLPYLAAVYAGIYIVFRMQKKPCSRGHIICSLLFTLGVVGIFAVTGVTPMSGFHTDVRMEEVNLVPFYGIVDMLGSAIENGDLGYAAANIIGNVVLFIPFGFGLPLLWKRFYSFKRTLFCGLIVSLLIECSQLVLCRGTDIDDLLLNTLGTVFGYVLYVKLHAILPGISRVAKEKNVFCLEAAGTIFLAYISYLLLGVYHYRALFSA